MDNDEQRQPPAFSGSLSGHYETLELDSSASHEQIVKAYRRKALQWHPDKNPEQKEKAEEVFKQIVEAQEILTDPTLRQAYDEQQTYQHFYDQINSGHCVSCSELLVMAGYTVKKFFTECFP